LSELRSELLFAGPVARIGNVVCCAPRSAPAAPEWVPDTRIVLPRRGVFALHRHGQGVVADGTSAVVLGAGEEYRVSHPADGGDECTVLVVPPELHEEAFGDLAGRQGILRPSTQLRARVLTSLATGLESEERALLLLDAVAADLGAAGPPPKRRPRYVDDARALLAADPTARWGLDALARAVHCSPFHLARRFRACTGETLARYRLRLRLGLALERIAGGETNLARLAAELGFAHHSHFTARFRSVFDTTPSEVRRIVTAGDRGRA
jgi:AraC family transcriptional regulator